MNSVALTGLVKIELPSTTLRFCDGAFFVYESETYRSDDPVYGTISQFQTMKEGVGDIVPAVVMTLNVPDTSAAADVSNPGNQVSRVQFIIAEFDVDTGVISTGKVMFDGQIDQTIFTVGVDRKELGISIVSLMERWFEANIGNTLNSTFHKSIWAGELGHDNGTGLSKPVAWGVESAVSSGGGGGGGGDGRGFGGVYWGTQQR